MDPKQELKAASRCVHAGYRPRTDGAPEERAVAPPLSRSSTFLLDDDVYDRILAGRWSEDYLYTRYRNPTLDVAARRLAALEGAERSLLFASGLAALHAAVLGSVPAGGRIVAANQLYGGSWDMLREGFGGLGFEVHFADVTEPASFARTLEQAGADGADLFLCESVSNPVMALADIPALAAAAHQAGAKLLVDATFATPLGQRPLELGADLVMHSASKYLGGHSDLIGGAVSGSETHTDGVWTWLRRAGGCMDPTGAWLLDRGMKTLALRMDAHAERATALARFLASHPAVAAVHYPGLESHPQAALAERMLDLPGGMLSFEMAGGDGEALALMRRLRLPLEATSLGGVESLVSLPFNTSHARMSAEERLAVGIRPGLVRISVGIEDSADLVADFAQALG
ncbi:MAG: aminotransferase class I/II-fold pyridoxal phosphate-dependent enzyme [Planctomycetota bacterium]|nr:aminotransferase class I/II-fold pyridoxal phosphate-dependent enzyme [Planctomycetota bacterium]